MNLKSIIDPINDAYGIQQVPSEWECFLGHVQKIRPNVVLEIGTAGGGSALCLSYFSNCIITVDVKSPKNKNVFNAIRNRCELHFVKLDSGSKKCMRQIIHFLNGRTVDLLIIDGSHYYRDAKRDFHRFSKLMSNNGTIAIHDIANTAYHRKLKCKVYKLWDEIKGDYNSFEISNNEWGGFGIITLPKLLT